MKRRVLLPVAGNALLFAGCGISIRRPRTAVPIEEVGRIDVDAAFAKMNAGRAILVDVRGADSYRARHAKGALQLDLTLIEQSPREAAKKLPADRQPIFYCT